MTPQRNEVAVAGPQKGRKPITVHRMKVELDSAERAAFAAARTRVSGKVDDVGTPYTVIKRRDQPVTRLLELGKIGPEELRAAEDIAIAFHALAGALFMKPPTMERRDPTHGTCEPARVVDAVSRYYAWMKIWAVRTTYGDPTIAVIIAAIIDERGFREIEQDLRLRNGAASRAVAAGLRDYAARAGWAQGQASRKWLVTEGAVFRLRKSAA
jgi:hypothetical protein